MTFTHLITSNRFFLGSQHKSLGFQTPKVRRYDWTPKTFGRLGKDVLESHFSSLFQFKMNVIIRVFVDWCHEHEHKRHSILYCAFAYKSFGHQEHLDLKQTFIYSSQISAVYVLLHFSWRIHVWDWYIYLLYLRIDPNNFSEIHLGKYIIWICHGFGHKIWFGKLQTLQREMIVLDVFGKL